MNGLDYPGCPGLIEYFRVIDTTVNVSTIYIYIYIDAKVHVAMVFVKMEREATNVECGKNV